MSPGSAPQSKPLEELSELYASAADAQEAAAASSDPVLARERLQAVLHDIAGAASFPAVTGEHPPSLFDRAFCQLSPCSSSSGEWFCRVSAECKDCNNRAPTQVLFKTTL